MKEVTLNRPPFPPLHWEDHEEHGAGVMTHFGRVVEIGQADTSFLEWIAERDIKSDK